MSGRNETGGERRWLMPRWTLDDGTGREMLIPRRTPWSCWRWLSDVQQGNPPVVEGWFVRRAIADRSAP